MSSEDEEQVQPIKRGQVEDSLSCPLCLDLLKDATTICVCLHTFCKDCIYAKFENDKSHNCPICDADLGSCPQETLRRDNNMENLRTKLLSKNYSKEPHRITKTVYRKKKKSLSSPAPVQSESFIEPKSGRPKIVDQKLGHAKNSPEANSALGSTSNRLSTVLKKKVSGDKEPHRVVETTTGPQKHLDPTSNLKQENTYDRFSALLEIANNYVDSEDIAMAGLPALSIGNDDKRVDTKSISGPNNNDMCSQNSRAEGEALHPSTHALESNERPTEQGITDLPPNGCNEDSQKAPHPIWLALEGCKDRKGKSSAQPQKFYVRLPDRNVPVSLVQKYIIHKLNLKPEFDQVELSLCGQTLIPEVMLNSLVDTWLCNLDMPVGSTFTSEEAMMLLTYQIK